MAENTTDLNAVMQAAELAQDIVDGNFPAVDISRRDPLYKQIDAGRKVAKALLSILPKGKRPVPVRIDRVRFVGMVPEEGVNCFGERPARPGDPEDSIREVKVYRSGEEGSVEAQYESLERHIRTMEEIAEESAAFAS